MVCNVSQSLQYNISNLKKTCKFKYLYGIELNWIGLLWEGNVYYSDIRTFVLAANEMNGS